MILVSVRLENKNCWKCLKRVTDKLIPVALDRANSGIVISKLPYGMNRVPRFSVWVEALRLVDFLSKESYCCLITIW